MRVLPGVTAANAAAARAGAPLGHDYATISLSDRLKPWEVIAERLHAAASADLVLALYNPGSASRTWQVAKARELLLEHRAPDTPVVVAPGRGRARRAGPHRAPGRPGPGRGRHAHHPADRLLADPDGTAAGDGEEIVWTPRRYPEN